MKSKHLTTRGYDKWSLCTKGSRGRNEGAAESHQACDARCEDAAYYPLIL